MIYHLLFNFYLFNKNNLKFILNYQIDIFIFIKYNYDKKMLNNNKCHEVIKKNHRDI